MPAPLPIDVLLPHIVDSLRAECNLVIEAPPGAGKTTRVPPALLDLSAKDTVVSEPRRIAARMAARRVAFELGTAVGETVGYRVRFEEVAGPKTRLHFVTEGMLTRQILSDARLDRTGIVILDEFHERHLDGDLALMLLRRLQLTSRPDLRIVVMSATLSAAPIAEFLRAPVLRSEGRLFPIEVQHTPHSADSLDQQVARAVEGVVNSELDGDILAFLPGAAEIRRAARACEKLARRAGLLILPLHGDLSPEEQDRAVAPASSPKLILSTNVAESSITIDGVTVVIDSGLARIANDSPSTGLATLEVRRISKSSAIQRAGRAGRTRRGRTVRLYTLEDFHRRPESERPEIERREISQLLLDLRALGIRDEDVPGLPWFQAPPAKSLAQAHELLERLNVKNPAALARLPLHPRLSKLLLDAQDRGCSAEACRIVAFLSSGERASHPDLLHVLEQNPPGNVAQIERQLRRLVPPKGRSYSDEQMRMSLLAAYPDRVARKRNANEAQLASGKSAALPEHWLSDFLVAVEVEDRKDQAMPLIRVASQIEPDWLIDLFPERVREVSEVTWNRTAERVEGRTALLYDAIALDESSSSAPEPEQAAELLFMKAMDAGIERFVDGEALEEFLARVEFASKYSDIQAITDVRQELRQLCTGLRSFAELRHAAAGLIPKLQAELPRAFEDIAPERFVLKGRFVKIHYVRNQPPWMASRLQDFFGMKETPKIARGQVPILLHLLAPNQRPVQMTTDLAGFWERLYPQVRKELSRRYPKHAWPEKP